MGLRTFIDKTPLNERSRYKGSQILSGALLHASWNFFGKKLEKELRHRRVTRC